MDPKVPLSSVKHKTMDMLTKEMKLTILKPLTRKNDQGKFWHQIDPESQKSQLIVMAIMDRLFWKIYDMTSTRQADRETHIKCSNPFWGSSSGSGGAPRTPTHLGQCSPNTQGDRHVSPPQLGSWILSFKNILLLVKFIIMQVKCIFKIRYNPKRATCIFLQGGTYIF